MPFLREMRKKLEKSWGKIWWNKIKAVPLHSQMRYTISHQLENGVLTERLGNGLQNRVERFDSARHLTEGSSFENFLFYFPTLHITPKGIIP